MRFVTRSEWNARQPHSTTPLRSRRGFAIHWVGGRVDLPDFGVAKAHVQAVQADHMEGRNSDGQPWADIAYSFLVWHDVVFEGRGWDNRSAANGSTDANADYLAICQLMSTDEAFNDQAKQATAELIRIGRENHGVGSEVWPHSHFFATECPGDDVRRWIAAGGYQATKEQAMTLVIDPVGVTASRRGEGGWAFGAHGHVYAFGEASYYGGWNEDTQNDPNRRCVGLVSTADGEGYWLVSQSGEVYAYGSAPQIGHYEQSWGDAPIIGAYANDNTTNGGVTLIRDDGSLLNPYALPLPGQ